MIVFNYRFHLLHAILCFIIVKLYFLPGLSYIAFTGCMVGFKIPDLDKKKTLPSQLYLIISNIIQFFCKHRGFTHSAISVIITYILFLNLEIFLSAPELTIGVLIGYISHLLVDMSTTRGIPLLWPFSIPVLNVKNLRIPLLHLSHRFAIFSWIFIFVYLIANHYNLISELSSLAK